MKNQELRDQLTGAIIGLVRACEGNEDLMTDRTNRCLVEGLCATVPHRNVEEVELQEMLAHVQEEKKRIVPDCFTCASPCGRTADYDMKSLKEAEKEIRSLKQCILLGCREIALYIAQSGVLTSNGNVVSEEGTVSQDVFQQNILPFLHKALCMVGIDFEKEALLLLVEDMAEVHLLCVEGVMSEGK